MQKLRNVSIKQTELDVSSEEAKQASVALDSQSGTMFTIAKEANHQQKYLASFPSQLIGKDSQSSSDENKDGQDLVNTQNENNMQNQILSQSSNVFSSIESQRSNTQFREIFNNKKQNSNTQSVLPEDSIFINDKKVSFTDTFSYPQCLRFSPQLSHKQTKITTTGLSAQALANNQKALCNMAFSEGVHYWEIICPISASTMRIGVVSKDSNQEVMQGFRTTTARTVGVELDITNKKLRFWLNGQYLRKERSKDLPTNNESWIPCVEFTEKAFVAILNPFVNLPALTPDKKDQKSRLPDNLTSLEQVQKNYLANKLSGYLFVDQLITEKAEGDIKERLKFVDLDFEFDVISANKPGKEPLLHTMLLKFKNHREALLWIQAAIDKLPRAPEVIDGLGLAQVLQFLKNQTGQLPENMKECVNKHKAFLLQNLIPQSVDEQILCGLEPQKSLSLTPFVNDLLQELQTNSNAPKDIEESKQNAQVQADDAKSNFAYVKKSNTIVIAQGDEIKAFQKDDLPNHLSFSNYPQMPCDEISLSIQKNDMIFVLQKLNFIKIQDRHIIKQFINYTQSGFKNERINLPYATALESVLSFLDAALHQYREIEELGFKLQERDITPKSENIFLEQSKSGCSLSTLSILEANRLLNILLNLEDQLWSMTQTDQAHASVKKLWPIQQARMHTAFGRLSSLLCAPDSVDVKILADLGIHHLPKIGVDTKFFQEPNVKVENIFENGDMPLLSNLERQFMHNYLIQGQISWNVNIKNTLNAMPPQVHKSYQPNKKAEGAKKTNEIQSIKTLDESGYIMSTSKEGSVNIWTSDLGLHRSGGVNFMCQKFIDPNSACQSDWTLPMDSKAFKSEKSNGVEILMRSTEKVQKEQQPKKEEKTEENGEEQEFDLGNLFEEGLSEEYGFEEPTELYKYESDDEQQLPAKLNISLYTALQANLTKPEAVSKKAPEQVKKETSKKTAQKAEDPKITEAKNQIKQQLMAMGFPGETIDKALKQMQNDKKELNINDAMEKILAVQEEEAKKQEEEKPAEVKKAVEYKVYTCAACTFINKNPKELCEVCGSKAPEDAIKIPEPSAEEIKAKEDEKLKKQKEEEEKKQKEQEAAQKEKERLEKKELAEKKRQEKLQESRTKCIDYYNNSEIVDFLFASCDKGMQVNPLISGAYFFDKNQKTCDLHLVSFDYKLSYMRRITNEFNNSPHQVQLIFNKLLAENSKCIESYYPVLMGQEQTNTNWTFETNRHESTNLTHSSIGVVRMQYDQIDSICQVGNDISEQQDQQIYVVVIGQKDGKQKSTVLQISIEDKKVKVENMDDLSESLNVIMQDEQIISLHYVSGDRFLLITKEGTVTMLKKEKGQVIQTVNQLGSAADDDKKPKQKLFFKMVWTLNLDENQQVTDVQNGLLTLKDGDEFAFYSCSEIYKKLLKQQKQRACMLQSEIDEEVISQEDVLKMSVDPSQVSITDLNSYENLMNSRVAPAYSNANSKQGQVKPELFVQHTWNVTQDQNDLKPFQLEFQQPTSLISLNLDLTFQCENTNQFFGMLDNNKQQALEAGKKDEPDSLQIDTTDNKEKEDNTQQSHNLGLFTISSFDEDNKSSAKDSGKNTKQEFLPLVVKHTTGCVYNANYIACKLLVNDQNTYASNYAKPELVFSHTNNLRMNVEQVVLRSAPNTKSGAFPLGEGLIFLSDTMQPLQNTGVFSNFKHSDYITWREERLKDDSRPLRPEEPVGYFKFDERSEMTFDLDFKRSAKYIMIKPTGFRTKPHAFNQSFNTMPVEVQFFGAIGKISTEQDQVQVNDASQNMSESRNILTDYSVEIKILNSDDTIQVIDNLKIHQLKLFEKTLNPTTIINYKKVISQTKLLGLSLYKLTDSRLQLQKIKGVSVSFKQKDQEKQLWSLVSAQIRGYEAHGSAKSEDGNNKLFNNDQIPSIYYRSCLMSPTFFSVINKQLALMVSSDKYSQKLRIRLMLILQKIIKINHQFLRMIFEQVDLKQFIKINIQNQSHQNISSSVEFLRHFQNEPEFCTKLYEILLQKVSELPENYMMYDGYIALVGMIKWAMPLDYQRVLDALVNTLYHKICKDKMNKLQTREAIQYRTRISQDQYPFDHRIFKGESSKKDTDNKDSAQSNSSNLVKDPSLLSAYTIQMEHQRLVTQQTIRFFAPVEINSLKLYFEKQVKDKYSLTLRIMDANNMVYVRYMDPTTTSSYTNIPYQENTNKNSDHACTISNLNYSCSNEIQIQIKMYITAPFMAQPAEHTASGIKFVPEFYGTMKSENEANTQHIAQIKEMEISQANKLSYGASINYLCKKQTHAKGETVTMTPQSGPNNETKQVNNTDGPQQPEQITSTETTEEPKKEASVDQTEQSGANLKAIQQELREEIRNDGKNVQELINRIEVIQNKDKDHEQYTSSQQLEEPTHQQLAQIVCDFTKLIQTIQGTHAIKREQFMQSFRNLAQQGEGLDVVCLDLFESFIVNEAGETQKQALSFLNESVMPLLTRQEKRNFFMVAINKFLSKPEKHFSQAAIVQALDSMSISESDLATYLAAKLGINSDQDSQLKDNPMAMMSSVLVLILKQLERLDLPEEYGKVVHKGVSCSLCQKKMIVGWLYKCGNCNAEGDINFDAACALKHQEQNPNHVMLIIQEPLPNKKKSKGSKSPSKNKSKPFNSLLPEFKFQSVEANTKAVHTDVSCENCGVKPIQGTCYKCSNCEDWNLCEKCYTENKYTHFLHHIFIQLHKPLLQADSSPVALLQVLDSRLTSPDEALQIGSRDEQANDKNNEVLDDNLDDEDFEDLAPLSMQRSISVPVERVKGITKKQEDSAGQMDYDNLHKTIFTVIVWICKDNKFFTLQQKTALLKIANLALKELGKVVNVKAVAELSEEREQVMVFVTTVLRINNKQLLSDYEAQLSQILGRLKKTHSQLILDLNQQKNKKVNPDLQARKEKLTFDINEKRKLNNRLVSIYQSILQCLIDIQADPDNSHKISNSKEVQSFIELNKNNKKAWLENMNFIMEMNIQLKNETDYFDKLLLKSLQEKESSKKGGLQTITEELLPVDEDADLQPLGMNRSLSHPIANAETTDKSPSQASVHLIKSLIGMLHNQNGQDSRIVSGIWVLALRSLTIVSARILVESHLVDQLMNAFLVAPKKIQQIMFPQILKISQTIVQYSIEQGGDHARFICSLLFNTLDSILNNSDHEQVGYQICRGWLDILKDASQGSDASQSKIKLEPDDVSQLLQQAGKYLILHLNKGTFDGSSGAQTMVVMRLQMIDDMLRLVMQAQSGKKLALQELFAKCETDSKARKDMSTIIDRLLTWLYLNGVRNSDHSAFMTIACMGQRTPATTAARKISSNIKQIMKLISDCVQNTEAIKIALKTNQTIVKQINEELVNGSENQSIGFDSCLKLSRKTNKLHKNLLSCWLVSEPAVNYYVFELKGFGFLLDCIGQEKSQAAASNQVENKSSEEKQDEKAIAEAVSSSAAVQDGLIFGSDIDMLMGKPDDITKEIGISGAVKTESKEKAELGSVQKDNKIFSSFQQTHTEFGKTMVLQSANLVPAINVNNYAKQDWTINKKAVKNRILTQFMNEMKNNEIILHFKLPQVALIREIQVGFLNYWDTSSEVYAEPISILVEAGMEQDNLNHVCTLEVVKDPCFNQANTTVFGKNIQEYSYQSPDVLNQSINQIIQTKLNSLNNFTAQYIKFSVRKNVVACLENSVLANRFEKRLAMALNFISVTGYKAENMSGVSTYMRSEQKKTALEVMSLICAGNFSSALKVIANQDETIDKIKSQFDMFVSLVVSQSQMIEPTLIGISSYNKDMGDWILNKFLTTEGYDKYADLAGKIIVCDKDQVAARVKTLLETIKQQIETLQQKHAKTDILQSLQRFIVIAVKTIHLIVPHMEEQVDINIKSDLINSLFYFIKDLNDQDPNGQCIPYLQFVQLIINPPKPFVNSAISLTELYRQLQAEVSIDDKHSQQIRRLMTNFMSVFAFQSSEVSNDLYSSLDFKNNLFDEKVDPIDRGVSAEVWSDIAKDPKIRAKLQTERLPIKIYNFMREDDPLKACKIIKKDSPEFSSLAKLMRELIVGNSELEQEMAELIIKDVEYLGTNRDEFFINQIFMPLIKNEKCIPVCINEKIDKSKWEINYDMLSFNQNNQKQKQEVGSSFLPSSILQGDARRDVIKTVQQVVGSQSKSKADQLLSAQWNMVYSSSEKVGAPNAFQNLWNNIQGKGPISLLLQFKNKSNNTKVIFGSYCSQNAPSVPAQFNQDFEYPVYGNDSDFVWCYQEGKGFSAFKLQKNESQQIMEFVTDYDGGGAISVASDFILMSFSHEFQCTVGYTETIEKINQEDNNYIPVTGELELEKQEVWIGNLNQKGQHPSAQSSSKDIKAKVQQLTGQYIYSASQNQPLHPWIKPDYVEQMYRARPVFMVPCHLKMSEVAKILLSEGVQFETKDNQSLQDDQILSDVYQNFLQDLTKSEQNNNILDLSFDLDQVYQTQEMVPQDNTQDINEKIAQQYVPQNGFYQQYEKHGGVKSFISVTLAQLQLWEDKKLAETWQMWLKELQSFSEMPMFFQSYLANHTCKELIFKVLNAAPDKDSKDAAKKKHWEEQQKNAVQFNYKILAEIFSKSKDKNIRQIAIENDFLPRILDRLGAISGEKPREYEEVIEEQAVEEKTENKEEKKEEVKNVNKKKRGGVGYSSKQGVTFDVKKYLENKQLRNEQIQILVDIVTKFFDTREWQAGQEVVDQILASPLLPLLENAFRNGSWLDMAKEATLYHSLLQLTRALTGQKKLAACLIEIDPNWKPRQTDPIYKLLEGLNGHVKNFLICLNKQQVSSEKKEDNQQELLANDFVKTHELVEEAVEKLLNNKPDEEDVIADALTLPIQQQYRALLSPLRFDYMDMKNPGGSGYKHNYQGAANSNQSPPTSKIIRLSQELADLANALPAEHTNAVFVRVDESRIDMMKAIITGATDTPYAHGCYEFDLFCENNYPNGPPKMNLMTTGNAQIRFNPNLYSCGKVCLSLLGTWRGSATENWDPKLSTILQVLLSTQAIIMSQEVYFNEPGFENEAGTPEGERRNEGYMNIVRYGNVKWAMLGQIKNPSKGFETAIKRHFYVKKAEILAEVNEWLRLAEVNEASYNGLVNDHNYNIAGEFKKSKTKYKEMLGACIKDLTEELNKLDKPSGYQIVPKQKKKRQTKQKKQSIAEGQAALEEVDMGDDGEQIDTNTGKDIDIEDDTVKDRWSRYIGAMGVEAVAKQAAAHIFVSGAGGLGIEIAKNLVLSGCKSFTLHDTQPVTNKDLSAQFFLSEVTKDKSRAEVCMPKLQQLNYYVKCKVAPSEPIPLDEAVLEKEPWNLQMMDVVVLTECDYATNIFVNQYCHKRGKKFISTDIYGVCARVFSDFGDKFEVLDKNGEEMQEVIVESISNEEQGIVKLPQNVKHNYEDGDEIMFTKVVGMKLKQGEKHTDPETKSDSINDTIHKVTVINKNSFKVGDTRMYEKYESQGICKQMRTKQVHKFKTFKEVMLGKAEDMALDSNLVYADFKKMAHTQLSHIAYEALDTFKKENKRMPGVWDKKDADAFLAIAKAICPRYEVKPEEFKEDGVELAFFYKFSFTAQGVFNPMCAFLGGYIAQETVKAITNKFTPTMQLFYHDALEVLPEFKAEKHLADFDNYVKTVQTKEVGHRSDGLRICVGNEIVEKLAYTRLFMVGAGAIGCELLKNYAMLGVGVGKKTEKNPVPGSIVLTDPDIIELSNLNRQFLFREKHLRKPKSQTAAAAAIHMNKELKENIIARLDRVSENSAHIFTDKFFEDLTCVTNALDNVKARKYIDARCVTAQTPLLESGTLGPKGHVQVILPFKTESYGSQEDPEDNNEIPFCTLKMFPEETIHCVEWAREKFNKMFGQKPKSLQKIVEEGENINTVSSSDIISLKDGLKLLRKRPKNFGDCVEHARYQFEKLFNHDARQLLHCYPLDAKTKEGNLFWTLPKRPPTPAVFDKDNLLHASFIQSLACLRATIFLIEIPSKNPRSKEFKLDVAEMASAFKVPEFVPDESKAKEIMESVDKASKKPEEEEKEEEKEEAEEEKDNDEVEKLKQEFLKIYKTLKIDNKKPIEEQLVKAEEFEKDNDANFHIDFIYSLGNLRAANYKLDPMEWIQVKLKAGRIVPALATTTASVAGMQTLEMLKILKNVTLEEHNNIFLNLAVPILQCSEPGAVEKVKLLEGVEVSLWDKWEIKNAKDMTLEGMIKELETKYKGLEVRNILRGNTPIYLHAIMSAEGKQDEKKQTLETSIRELTECDKDDLYVDLNVTCIKSEDKDNADAQIIKGVPVVRVHF